MRAYAGPAILSYGFRPFFLAGAVWAATAVALWLPMLAGRLTLPTLFAPIEWHVHELIYGYVPAIVAGFLLTAVPNWTGRLPVIGTPLLALFLTWVAGRLAILVSAWIGAGAAAAVDLLFLPVLAAVIAREIVAGDNTRNLKVLAMVALLFAGNATFHVEAAFGTGNGYGVRIGIGAAVLLITLIGGRIVPSFTRNWLARQGPGRLPEPFGRFDAAVMVANGVTLASWVAAPQHAATALLAVAAGGLNAVRLGRWAGDRTAAEPLVLVLHVAYAFVPIGFGLLALGIAAPTLIAPSGALHSWTAGAIGLMTLAVMTRASLGHTGRPLTATPSIQLIYIAALTAALARILAAFDIAREAMLHLSATAWVLAFAGFAVVYAPLLMRRRP
ncbi:MAG: NnrS family protein [Hyphomicrobiaceae bacterium]|nr:MAG: NnrS family protein [Hyphomicrobiaceae bacterium]